MEIISFVSSAVSIILSIYAIWFAKRESNRSEECYIKTMGALEEIKDISNLNFKATGYTENQLADI